MSEASQITESTIEGSARRLTISVGRYAPFTTIITTRVGGLTAAAEAAEPPTELSGGRQAAVQKANDFDEGA